MSSACGVCNTVPPKGALVCPSCGAPTRSKRLRWFLWGAGLSVVPAIIGAAWIWMLGGDFIVRYANRHGFDERLVYIYGCFAAIVVELFSMYVLARFRKEKFDLIYLGCLAFTLIAVLLSVIEFGMIAGIAMCCS